MVSDTLFQFRDSCFLPGFRDFTRLPGKAESSWLIVKGTSDKLMCFKQICHNKIKTHAHSEVGREWARKIFAVL